MSFLVESKRLAQELRDANRNLSYSLDGPALEVAHKMYLDDPKVDGFFLTQSEARPFMRYKAMVKISQFSLYDTTVFSVYYSFKGLNSKGDKIKIEVFSDIFNKGKLEKILSQIISN